MHKYLHHCTVIKVTVSKKWGRFLLVLHYRNIDLLLNIFFQATKAIQLKVLFVMVTVRSNGFVLFVMILFTNSVIEIASRSSDFRSNVNLRRDKGRNRFSSDGASEGSRGLFCMDTSGSFTVESLGITMRCDDLNSQNDRYGCTASKVREKVGTTISHQNCNRIPPLMLTTLISHPPYSCAYSAPLVVILVRIRMKQMMITGPNILRAAKTL